MSANRSELKKKYADKPKKNEAARVEDSYGQWLDGPRVATIPSSNITMEDVPYPVLGIDDKGNAQLMMPGANYTFPGDRVTEYPMMQLGGMVKALSKHIPKNKIKEFISNIYKHNPAAFKPNPDSYYRMIGGKKGVKDIIYSDFVRANPKTNKSWTMLNTENSGKTWFAKGMPASERVNRKLAEGYKGPYMVEYTPNKGVPRHINDGSDYFGFLDPIPYNPKNIKLYKEHWLKGFEEVNIRNKKLLSKEKDFTQRMKPKPPLWGFTDKELKNLFKTKKQKGGDARPETRDVREVMDILSIPGYEATQQEWLKYLRPKEGDPGVIEVIPPSNYFEDSPLSPGDNLPRVQRGGEETPEEFNDPIRSLENSFMYTDRDLDRNSIAQARARECLMSNGEKCLASSNDYFNKYVARQLGVPTTWDIAESAGIKSGGKHGSFDSWDQGALMPVSELLYNKRTSDTLDLGQMIANGDITIGTYLGVGEPGHFAQTIDSPGENRKYNLTENRHSVRAVGFNDKTGAPIVLDQGRLVTLTPDFRSGGKEIQYIMRPNAYKDLTYEKIKDKYQVKMLDYDPTDKLQFTDGNDPENIEEWSKHTNDERAFLEGLNETIPKIMQILGISQKEANRLAKVAYGIGQQESGVGSSYKKFPKQMAATTVENLFGRPASRGLIQMKIKEHIKGEDGKTTPYGNLLKELGVRESDFSNIDSPAKIKNQAAAALGLLAMRKGDLDDIPVEYAKAAGYQIPYPNLYERHAIKYAGKQYANQIMDFAKGLRDKSGIGLPDVEQWMVKAQEARKNLPAHPWLQETQNSIGLQPEQVNGPVLKDKYSSTVDPSIVKGDKLSNEEINAIRNFTRTLPKYQQAGELPDYLKREEIYGPYNLKPIEITADAKYPYLHTLTKEERSFLNDDSPIGTAVRQRALSGKKGQTTKEIEKLLKEGAMYTGIGAGIGALAGLTYPALPYILPALNASPAWLPGASINNFLGAAAMAEGATNLPGHVAEGKYDNAALDLFMMSGVPRFNQAVLDAPRKVSQTIGKNIFSDKPSKVLRWLDKQAPKLKVLPPVHERPTQTIPPPKNTTKSVSSELDDLSEVERRIANYESPKYEIPGVSRESAGKIRGAHADFYNFNKKIDEGMDPMKEAFEKAQIAARDATNYDQRVIQKLSNDPPGFSKWADDIIHEYTNRGKPNKRLTQFANMRDDELEKLAVTIGKFKTGPYKSLAEHLQAGLPISSYQRPPWQSSGVEAMRNYLRAEHTPWNLPSYPHLKDFSSDSRIGRLPSKENRDLFIRYINPEFAKILDYRGVINNPFKQGPMLGLNKYGGQPKRWLDR